MALSTIISISAKDLQSTEVANLKSPDSSPKDLGVYGETFPIQEEGLLEVIKTRLQALAESGRLKDHQQKIVKQARQQIRRPAPVQGVRHTTHPRSFAYDPSITVPYDLKDHRGQIFHHKGTRINPLDTQALRCPFLFVDGDDSVQVAWAIRQHQAAKAEARPKIILVQGAPLELTQRLGLPVYFDQSGRLVRKFGIIQVPARVSQQNRKLLIEEVNISREKW